MPEDILKYLGGKIKAARNESRLTQQELADQTGKGLRHIQNIEKGKINPSYEVLLALVRRLGLSADSLFYPEGTEQEKEAKHVLGKLSACTPEERQFLLKTLDCMAEQFISRH